MRLPVILALSTALATGAAGVVVSSADAHNHEASTTAMDHGTDHGAMTGMDHGAMAHTPVAQVKDGGSRPDPTATLGTVGGPFTMLDQNGTTVTEKNFAGKYMIVFFGFTFCPDICPTELQTATNALSMLSTAQARKVQVVFVTVDPARDTPAVLKDYLNQFGDNLVGLTGSVDQVAAITKAYKVYYNRATPDHASHDEADDYMMDHSSFLYLMGPDGKFIKVFPAGTTVDTLAGELKSLVTP